MSVQPFRVDVGEDVWADLRERVRRTRWPDAAPGEPWGQGVDLGYLQSLLAYWADGFDWPRQQAWLNSHEHRLVDLDDVRLHTVGAADGRGRGRLPLLLTHGWPSTFVELLPLLDRLGDAFEVVVVSPPGYPFSSRPAALGVDRVYVADVCHRMMTAIGHERYGVCGGDFGAGVATSLALAHPESVVGIHLSTAEMTPYTGPGAAPLTDEEREFCAQVDAWDATERGYSSVQSTRPQTLGYALTDSPAGLAAWVLDKWRSWSDSGGDLDATFGRDFLLTMLTVWWASGSITASMRDYYDNRWHTMPLGPDDHVTVPTAMAFFPHELVPEALPPRSWYERLYEIRRWTVSPHGGHFVAAEQPDVLARDVVEFFGSLTEEARRA